MLTKGLNVCLAMIVIARGRADFFSLNIFSEFVNNYTERHIFEKYWLFVAAGAKSLSQEYYF